MSNILNMPATPATNELDRLAAAWQAAKEAEAAANKQRTDIEAAICELVGVKDEGSTSVKGDHFKVTTTGGVTRKLDADMVEQLYKGMRIPEAIFNRLFRFKPELVTKELRYVQNNEPDIYTIIAPAITTTPRKPSVKVEPLEVK